MIIRQATLHDSTLIQQLLMQLGYPDVDETFVTQKITYHTQEDYHLLVGELKHTVAGFISLHWFDMFHSRGKMGRITAFCVDERFRSQGIGMKLLTAAENVLISKGCTKLEVTSHTRRTRTHTFYLKAGYTEDSKRFIKYITPH